MMKKTMNAKKKTNGKKTMNSIKSGLVMITSNKTIIGPINRQVSAAKVGSYVK